jgi:hypothetical protein
MPRLFGGKRKDKEKEKDKDKEKAKEERAPARTGRSGSVSTTGSTASGLPLATSISSSSAASSSTAATTGAAGATATLTKAKSGPVGTSGSSANLPANSRPILIKSGEPGPPVEPFMLRSYKPPQELRSFTALLTRPEATTFMRYQPNKRPAQFSFRVNLDTFEIIYTPLAAKKEATSETMPAGALAAASRPCLRCAGARVVRAVSLTYVQEVRRGAQALGTKVPSVRSLPALCGALRPCGVPRGLAFVVHGLGGVQPGQDFRLSNPGEALVESRCIVILHGMEFRLKQMCLYGTADCVCLGVGVWLWLWLRWWLWLWLW